MMRWLRRISIYYKINMIIVGVLLLLSLLLGLVVRDFIADLARQQMENRGFEVASYVAALSVNDILLDNHYSLYERVNKTKTGAGDVRYILITDYAGRLLAHSFSDGLPAGLPRTVVSVNEFNYDHPYQVVRYHSNEGMIREVMVPIENADIGFVRVGMSERRTQAVLDQKIGEFFLLALLALVVAGSLATLLAAVIIRPIRRLAQVAGEIGGGNYEVRAEVNTADEVGKLGQAFNDMTAGLKQKDDMNRRLLEELRAKEEMRAVLINRLFTVQEDERKHLARELHDEAGQSISGLLAYMKVLLSRTADPEQQELLLGARDVIVRVLDDMRRMAVELRPPVLDDHGIVAALEKYVFHYREQYRLDCRFNGPARRLPVNDQTALALYRICQESLTNVHKHARATRIDVVLADSSAGMVTLRIADNGRGFTPDTLDSARRQNHLGVYGMRERAELLGGSFDIVSGLGRGTTVTVVLPLQGE